jgi:hypothetical protein
MHHRWVRTTSGMDGLLKFIAAMDPRVLVPDPAVPPLERFVFPRSFVDITSVLARNHLWPEIIKFRFCRCRTWKVPASGVQRLKCRRKTCTVCGQVLNDFFYIPLIPRIRAVHLPVLFLVYIDREPSALQSMHGAHHVSRSRSNYLISGPDELIHDHIYAYAFKIDVVDRKLPPRCCGTIFVDGRNTWW